MSGFASLVTVGMNTGALLFSVACISLTLGACTTSLHGSFVTSSYTEEADRSASDKLGPVEGRSCQTRPLYVFASGNQATTGEAINEAKAMHEGTRFIADISIDDETQWGVGYSVQCIVVRAIAYQ